MQAIMAEKNLTDRSLRVLKPDEAVRYAGIVWQVDERSTYSDRQGYQTTEWLLTSTTRHQYFLLREAEIESESDQVTWYIAEELGKVAIVNVEVEQLLWGKKVQQAMVEDQQPYPVLKVANRTYFFESATRGTYVSEDEEAGADRQERITWDYWDEPHVWNLALEAWPNGDLKLYNTREVEPKEFSLIDRTAARAAARKESADRQVQLTMAWFLMGLGFVMMITGD